MPGKKSIYVLTSIRVNLIVMLCFILFISLFTFAQPLELTLSNGAAWNGKIGDRVEVVTKIGRKSETIEGILKSSTELSIVVEFNSRGKPIMINRIESMITLAVSDDLQIIENNDDKEIATPSIEIDLAKLLFLFHKGYRFQYYRQKFLSSRTLKTRNPATQASQPMTQPAIQPIRNRYAVIDLTGSFGKIDKLPNRKYSTLFITACTLEPAFKEIKKQTKKIRHVVFKIDSTGGDKGAIFDVGQLLDVYSTHFTYHGVVVNTSPELSPLIGKFANTYTLNSTGGPNSVSSIADIGRKLGLQEWVEVERISSYVSKQRLTLRKRILEFMVKEEKLFLSILQYKNKLEQAALSLKGIYEAYDRILADEKRFTDASLYEKQMDQCYLEILDKYVRYETGWFTRNAKNAWDNNFSSLARNWESLYHSVNKAGAVLIEFNKELKKIGKQKSKYHDRFDCITVTHENLRNQYTNEIHNQLESVYNNLEEEVTRLVNYHVQPGDKKNEAMSRMGKYPEYYVKPPCL